MPNNALKKKALNEPNAVKGFSRFAHVYDQYNMIQKEAAKKLVSMIEVKHYPAIVDVGCGSGAVFMNVESRGISFDRYIALDLSSQMLALHPCGETIEKVCWDFNAQAFPSVYCNKKEALMLSSSALQWSDDLDRTLTSLSRCAEHAYFAIFTSGTFKTLHQTAGISSPIYDTMQLKKTIHKYYHADFELERYQLEFTSTKEMFRYIQKSGVSGGERKLGYRQMKRVIEEYPLEYLEFEVLFVRAISKVGED